MDWEQREQRMRHRIAMWAAVGLLVAGCWAVVAGMIPFNLATGFVGNLAAFTQPVALLSIYFHFGMRFYWVMLANAATYALVGLMVESLRRSLHHRKVIRAFTPGF
jgi:FtsH-binding integral membrane protein